LGRGDGWWHPNSAAASEVGVQRRRGRRAATTRERAPGECASPLLTRCDCSNAPAGVPGAGAGAEDFLFALRRRGRRRGGGPARRRRGCTAAAAADGRRRGRGHHRPRRRGAAHDADDGGGGHDHPRARDNRRWTRRRRRRGRRHRSVRVHRLAPRDLLRALVPAASQGVQQLPVPPRSDRDRRGRRWRRRHRRRRRHNWRWRRRCGIFGQEPPGGGLLGRRSRGGERVAVHGAPADAHGGRGRRRGRRRGRLAVGTQWRGGRGRRLGRTSYCRGRGGIF
jgi:hypothetical protein